jgi:succinate dehydrogenase/fumarate reductase flavoprotein subunit
MRKTHGIAVVKHPSALRQNTDSGRASNHVIAITTKAMYTGARSAARTAAATNDAGSVIRPSKANHPSSTGRGTGEAAAVGADTVDAIKSDIRFQVTRLWRNSQYDHSIEVHVLLARYGTKQIGCAFRCRDPTRLNRITT